MQNSSGAVLPRSGCSERPAATFPSRAAFLLQSRAARSLLGCARAPRGSDPPTQDGGMTWHWNPAAITPFLFCKEFWHNPKASHWAPSQVFHSGAAWLSRSPLPAKRGGEAHGRLPWTVLPGHVSLKVGCPGPGPGDTHSAELGPRSLCERLCGETASFPGRVRARQGAARADLPRLHRRGRQAPGAARERRRQRRGTRGAGPKRLTWAGPARPNPCGGGGKGGAGSADAGPHAHAPRRAAHRKRRARAVPDSGRSSARPGRAASAQGGTGHSGAR